MPLSHIGQELTAAAILRNDAIDLPSDEDLADDALEQLIKSKEEAEIFNPSLELKLLHKNSILVWSVDLSLKMPTHHHCSGVVTIISSSATSSMPRHRQRRTRSHGDQTSILVPLLPVLMAHVKRKKIESAPFQTLMASSLTSWYKVPK